MKGIETLRCSFILGVDIPARRRCARVETNGCFTRSRKKMVHMEYSGNYGRLDVGTVSDAEASILLCKTEISEVLMHCRSLSCMPRMRPPYFRNDD